MNTLTIDGKALPRESALAQPMFSRSVRFSFPLMSSHSERSWLCAIFVFASKHSASLVRNTHEKWFSANGTRRFCATIMLFSFPLIAHSLLMLMMRLSRFYSLFLQSVCWVVHFYLHLVQLFFVSLAPSVSLVESTRLVWCEPLSIWFCCSCGSLGR